MTQTSGNPALPAPGGQVSLVGFHDAEARTLASHLAGMGLRSGTPRPAEWKPCAAILISARACLEGELDPPLPQLLEQHTPLIAVGTCAEIDAVPSLQLHAAECVVTPYCARELAIRVRRALARTVQTPPRAENRTVLIADDDPSVARLAAGMLRSLGLECHIAENGFEALEKARLLLPGLLILDVRLPYMSGVAVLSALRSDPGTAALKVLMLTGENNRETIGRCHELGVGDFVIKPFQAMDFLKRVRALVLPPPARGGCGAARAPIPATA